MTINADFSVVRWGDKPTWIADIHSAYKNSIMSRQTASFTLAFGALALGACSANDTTKTAWSSSPGGEWLTRIVRNDTSGPGNNYLSETVQLKRRTAKETVNILTLEDNSRPARIELHWREPTQLTLEHTGGAVVFQVARVGELAIETRKSEGGQ